MRSSMRTVVVIDVVGEVDVVTEVVAEVEVVTEVV